MYHKKNSFPETCCECGGKKFVKENADFEAHNKKGQIVMLKKIPTIFCLKCNEAYYDTPASIMIDLKLKKFNK